MKRLLYRDDHFIALFKAHDLFVHPSGLGPGQPSLMKRWRNLLDTPLYPVHRLDRATAGLVLFALNPEAAKNLASQFRNREMDKRYLAIVRGYTDDSGTIDHPLKKEKNQTLLPAITQYKRLAKVELPYPVGRYATARYSLLETRPETGRQHQIRRHCLHISHPIVGDRVYGDGRHNHFMAEHLQSKRLWLFARSLAFRHPVSQAPMFLEAKPDSDWRRACAQLFAIEDLSEVAPSAPPSWEQTGVPDEHS